MNVKILTFKTNHSIMGEVEENSISYTIKKPVQVVMQPSKDGPVVAFSPFLSFTEDFESGIELSKSDILCSSTPLRELVNQYSEMFGSGIQIASAIPKF